MISGGRIFCGLKEGFVEALAVRDGRIVSAGSVSDVAELAGPSTKRVDLAGRVAIPAFNDAHMHLLPLGVGMVEVNLRPEEGILSVDDVLSRVADAARTKKPGEWVLGRGYDHNEFRGERRHPTADELDRVAPDNPVFIKRTCGHVAVANSLGLKAAGIGQNTLDPAGGLIERRNNKLTGLLAERAMLLVSDAIPRIPGSELVDAIERAGKFMLSQGFTGVMDAAVGQTGMVEVEAYEEAARTNRLPVRTWVCLYGDPGGVAEDAHAQGFHFGREVGLLRYGAMKIFTDGSAGGLTAAVSEPYLVGEPGNTGILVFKDEEAHGLLGRYHAQGYQLAIHAIGDTAIEQVLSGIEKAGTADKPIAGRRHRIEHCGFVTEDQLQRMKTAGIYPVPQPIFLYEFGDLYIENLGPERSAASYPMRRWLDDGLLPAASSDAPVSTTDPFKNLYTMVTRRSRRGTVLGEDQRLTMEEAVHCYTYCGAFSQFAEEDIGRLIPGQLADIAILSHDIFACDPKVVETEARCDMTILGGEIVFERGTPAI